MSTDIRYVVVATLGAMVAAVAMAVVAITVDAPTVHPSEDLRSTVAPLAAMGHFARSVANPIMTHFSAIIASICHIKQATTSSRRQLSPVDTPSTVDPNWYVDTGAIDYITNDLECLTTKDRYTGSEGIMFKLQTGQVCLFLILVIHLLLA